MKEYSNIAVAEFKSVARGIIATDAMLKAAAVALVSASTLCPGKYLSVMEGEISALSDALKAALKIAGAHLNSSELVSGVDNKVIDAIGGKVSECEKDAIGIIEGPQMASIIQSADILVDSANVDFIDFRLARGCGVNSYYVYCGTYSAVSEATRHAVDFLKSAGALLAFKILPSPDRQVLRWLKSSLCRC